MAEQLDSWDKAREFARSLSGTESSTSYGKPCVKIAANGQTFLILGKEPETSFGVLIDLGTVEMLKETEPETYWQSPHYQGYPAVLIRFDSNDPERVREVISLAREQAAAKKPVRKRKS